MLGQKFGSLNIHFNRDANVTDFLEIPVFSIVESYGNSWRYMQVNVDVINVFQVGYISFKRFFSLVEICALSRVIGRENCQKRLHDIYC